MHLRSCCGPSPVQGRSLCQAQVCKRPTITPGELKMQILPDQLVLERSLPSAGACMIRQLHMSVSP